MNFSMNFYRNNIKSNHAAGEAVPNEVLTANTQIHVLISQIDQLQFANGLIPMGL